MNRLDRIASKVQRGEMIWPVDAGDLLDEINRLNALIALADEQLRVNNALLDTYRDIAIDSNKEAIK